jgi:hypothetical protein
MIGEVRSRHRAESGRNEDGPGGFRDIEMILLSYKAKHGLREPVKRKLVNTLCEIEVRHREDFEVLIDSSDFIGTALWGQLRMARS